MVKRAKIEVLDIPGEQQLRTLLEMAVRYRDLKPWTWMDESDLFSIIDPVTHVRYYIAILGGSEIDCTLAAFRGLKGLVFYFGLRNEALDLYQFDTMARLEAMYFSLEDKRDLEPEDMDLLRRFGVKGHGRFSWPVFRSMYEGKVPAPLTGTECRTMIHVIEQTIDICTRAREDKSFLYPPKKRGRRKTDWKPSFLTRSLTELEGVAEWREAFMEIESNSISLLALSIHDAGDRDQLLALPLDEERVWEVDASYIKIPVREGKSSSGYYPLLFSILDDDRGILQHNLGKSLEQDGDQFVDLLLGQMKADQARPCQIMTCKPEITVLISKICTDLSIELIELEELENTDLFIEGLTDHMSGVLDDDD